ncbi:MAG: amino acid deaminase/aldolase, partial [Corynebacterium sp.]|nr:amino acid deaminase/aldolase [Corynebacterium sp.]
DVAAAMALGDHVWFRPATAGEQAEFAESVLVVSDGDIIDEWPTYRGEGRSFT